MYNKIEFAKEKLDAIICLDANIPDKNFFSKCNYRKIIAADGAAIKLFNIDIIPDFVVGDLDSFCKSEKSKEFPLDRIIHIADQDTNDFEKCLIFSMNNNINKIMIVGFHGGLLEHTLNNWSVLMKYYKYIPVLFVYDEHRFIIPICNTVVIETYINEIISLIPQPQVVLTTHNLEWELNNEVLELGIREGARNVAKANQCSLIIHSGELLYFCDDKLPMIPILKLQVFD